MEEMAMRREESLQLPVYDAVIRTNSPLNHLHHRNCPEKSCCAELSFVLSLYFLSSNFSAPASSSSSSEAMAAGAEQYILLYP